MCATPLLAGDIEFSPTITQSQFREFSSVVSQAVFANPVEPARATSLLGFDIGIAATAIQVDDDAAYWTNSVASDFTTSGYLVVPRLVASKGLGAVTVAGSYAKVPDSDIQVIGGSIDVPIIRGTVVTPTIAVRGTYSQLLGVDEFKLKNYGVEGFISKGFGPITPYAGAGIVRTQSSGDVQRNGATLVRLDDEFDTQRITVGVRLSLLIPKIVVEATQGENDRTYAAKISLGL